MVYAKRQFRGPEQVFRYLSRYTHRIAISDMVNGLSGEGANFGTPVAGRQDGPDRQRTSSRFGETMVSGRRTTGHYGW